MNNLTRRKFLRTTGLAVLGIGLSLQINCSYSKKDLNYFSYLTQIENCKLPIANIKKLSEPEEPLFGKREKFKIFQKSGKIEEIAQKENMVGKGTRYKLDNLKVWESYVPETRQDLKKAYLEYFEIATRKVFQKTCVKPIYKNIYFPSNNININAFLEDSVIIVNRLVDFCSVDFYLENLTKKIKGRLVEKGPGNAGETTTEIKIGKESFSVEKRYSTILCTRGI